MNQTNSLWKQQLHAVSKGYDFISKPRGMEVKEKIAGQYKVPMPAYLSLKSRKVNTKFMFAEAAWIISGSNRLEDIEPYMKKYADFSDDGVFLRGAYGPKVVDQLSYVVDTIVKDNDTRQAVINIWRERPGASKDIPCTLSMQFLLRDGKLNMVTTMRSNDIVLGFTYDVFTFSMVAKSVQLLLKQRGIKCELGDLYVNAGSLHLYETHYAQIETWFDDREVDKDIENKVKIYTEVKTYEELISSLQRGAQV